MLHVHGRRALSSPYSRHSTAASTYDTDHMPLTKIDKWFLRKLRNLAAPWKSELAEGQPG